MPLLKLNFNQFVCGAEGACFVGLFLGIVDHNTLIIIHYSITFIHVQYIIVKHYHYMYVAQACHCMHRHSK